MRTHPAVVLLAGALVFGACASSDEEGAGTRNVEEVRQQIEEQIERGVLATRDEDIEAYMAGLPDDLVIYDEHGGVISREQQRAAVLRDWEVITRTLGIAVVVDSLALAGDSAATVYTSQRWERMMLRPDRSGEDTVLTTQRHRETWRRTPQGWRMYEVEELGGTVMVNGKPYSPR